MSDVHKTASEGFGSGTNELYDRARPSYPSASLATIRKAVKSQSALNIIEMGSGTGLFTRSLLAHPDWQSINELKALEPSQGMRDVFEATTKDPRVSTAEGTFDTTNVESGWADVLIIAQAFHWCPDFGAAAAEFSRILKPDGTLVFIWNLEDRDAAEWVAQLRDRIEIHEDGAPQYRLGLWRAIFATPSYKAHFTPAEEHSEKRIIPTTVEAVIERAHSKSYITILSPEDRVKVTKDVTEIAKQDNKVWIDQAKGIFEYPYTTLAVIARRK